MAERRRRRRSMGANHEVHVPPPSRMADMVKERSNKSSPVWTVVILLLLASVPLYVLSTGPAIWLRDHGMVSQQTLVIVYAPIGWLNRNVPVFRDAFQSYLR